jgi:uncharacterized membrane protein
MKMQHSRFGRYWRHFRLGSADLDAVFGRDGLDEIEATIAQGEASHSAEVRFAVESSLDIYRVWAGVSPRDRALTHFSRLGIWDTEANNGVLIYLLLADRAVEIVVDRQAFRLIAPQVWEESCRVMTQAFRQDKFLEGVVDGLKVIHPALSKAFPLENQDRNELSNQVINL